MWCKIIPKGETEYFGSSGNRLSKNANRKTYQEKCKHFKAIHVITIFKSNSIN